MLIREYSSVSTCATRSAFIGDVFNGKIEV